MGTSGRLGRLPLVSSSFPGSLHGCSFGWFDVQEVDSLLEELSDIGHFFRSEDQTVVDGPVPEQAGLMKIIHQVSIDPLVEEIGDPVVKVAALGPLVVAQTLDRGSVQGGSTALRPGSFSNRRLSEQ